MTPGGFAVSQFFPRWTPRAFLAWEDAEHMTLPGWRRYCDELAWLPRENRVLVGACTREVRTLPVCSVHACWSRECGCA